MTLYDAICFGLVALLGVVLGFWACVLGIMQASDGRRIRWLLGLCATGIGVPTALLAITVLSIMASKASTPANGSTVALPSWLNALVGATEALVLAPLLALPMVIVSLLFGTFAAPAVESLGTEQRGRNVSLTPAAMRDITTFRLQVEAQLAAATRDRLNLSFDDARPVAAHFDVGPSARGTFVCEKVGANSGVRTTWLVSFSDGQQASIDAREDTLLQAISAWQPSTV
jgi:hypothetical protein